LPDNDNLKALRQATPSLFRCAHLISRFLQLMNAAVSFGSEAEGIAPSAHRSKANPLFPDQNICFVRTALPGYFVCMSAGSSTSEPSSHRANVDTALAWFCLRSQPKHEHI